MLDCFHVFTWATNQPQIAMDQSTNKGYRAWTNTTLGKKKTKYNSNRMELKIVKKSSSQNLYHIRRTCTCSTGTGEKYGSAHLTENAGRHRKQYNVTVKSTQRVLLTSWEWQSGFLVCCSKCKRYGYGEACVRFVKVPGKLFFSPKKSSENFL